MEKYQIATSFGSSLSYSTVECFSYYGIKSHLYLIAAMHEHLGNTVIVDIDRNLRVTIEGKQGNVVYTATQVN